MKQYSYWWDLSLATVIEQVNKVCRANPMGGTRLVSIHRSTEMHWLAIVEHDEPVDEGPVRE